MQSPRDKIANALFKVFEQLNGTGPGQFDFVYFSRKFKMYDNLTPADQPAFCMCYLSENQSQTQAFGLREYIMDFLCQAVFQTNPNDSLTGEQIAFSILDSLDTFFPGSATVSAGFPIPGQAQTLGGLVTAAYVDGVVQLDNGIIEQPMVLMWRVKVLAGQ